MFQSGDRDAARLICQGVLNGGEQNLDALNMLAVMDIQDGAYDAAIEKMQRAIRVSGGNSAYFKNLGHALLKKGDFNDAAQAFLKAILTSPAETSGPLYSELALALERSGAVSEARMFSRLGLAAVSGAGQKRAIKSSDSFSRSPLKANGIQRADDFRLGKADSKKFGFPKDEKAIAVPPVTDDILANILSELDSVLEELIILPEIKADLDVLRAAEKNFSNSHYFLVATGRCGTHALQTLLESSSRVNPIHDTRFNVLSDRRNEVFYAQVHRLFEKRYLIVLLKDLIQQVTFDLLAAVQDGRSCVVTSHGHTVYAPFIKHILPNSKFIYLHRDPAQVFLSLYTKACYVGQIEPLSIDVARFYKEFSYEAVDWDLQVKIAWYIHVSHAYGRALSHILPSDRYIDVASDKLFQRHIPEFMKVREFIGVHDLTEEMFSDIYADKINEKLHRLSFMLSPEEKEKTLNLVRSLFVALEAKGQPVAS